MNQEKYIGMDVHQATISVAVMNSAGQLIMECILEAKTATIPVVTEGSAEPCRRGVADTPYRTISTR